MSFHTGAEEGEDDVLDVPEDLNHDSFFQNRCSCSYSVHLHVPPRTFLQLQAKAYWSIAPQGLQRVMVTSLRCVNARNVNACLSWAWPVQHSKEKW